MVFDIKDIQVFVFTCNRPQLVLQTLESLQRQTLQGFDCYILDNSDNNQTRELLKSYGRFTYIKTDASASCANFSAAQSLMNKAYAMILHDDDLIHPQYLEVVLKVLNNVDDVSYVSSKNTIFHDGDLPQGYLQPKPLKQSFYLLDNQDYFILSFWSKPNSNWSSAVIKTELYKKPDLAKIKQDYGKTCDLVMLGNIFDRGKAIIFDGGDFLFYRCHKDSDSNNQKTAQTKTQLENYLAFFYRHSRKHAALRRLYFLYALDNLEDGFFIAENCEKELEVFIKYLVSRGIISPAMALYRKRKINLFLRLLFFPLQLFYKRNYYKKYLTRL